MGLPGPALLRVTRQDGRAGCIDAHEVTQAQYHAFAESVGVDGFNAMGTCAGITPHPEPNKGADDILVFDSCEWGAYQPEKTPTAPVGCLAHCHAEAYCRWAGKELCGGFDDDTTLTQAQAADPAKSIWASACTNGGVTTVSHASAEAEACGPARTSAQAQTEPVDAYAACHGQGAYTEAIGLSGGVSEWVNARRDPFGQQTQGAWLPMGPHWAIAGESACGASNMGSLTWGGGFRCCKRLP